MITIYTTSSCSSCRKAKKWLSDHEIPYNEVNLFVKELSVDELAYILQRTENGTEDIISKKSKVISSGEYDVDSMTLNELYEFLIEHPSALRRPILIDDRHFQVGYNGDEIRAFIPRELRNISCDTCDEYENCCVKEEE